MCTIESKEIDNVVVFTENGDTRLIYTKSTGSFTPVTTKSISSDVLKKAYEVVFLNTQNKKQ